MTVRVLPVAEVLAHYDRFDAVIDARSPAEFALDHLPEAQNWPVLDDADAVYAPYAPPSSDTE
jgi:tRNA 2-selenouridine synthase